jgi:glutamate-1-semialdehyde 2,1-aminomutase
VLGKGIANGFPLSAVVGKKDLMMGFNDIFFSTTFGGETLSLAAAKAAINKLINTDSLKSIHHFGQKLMDSLNALINQYGIESKVQVVAHPSWSFLDMSNFYEVDPMKLKTLYIQTMLENNVICLGTHNISAAFKEKELVTLCAAYEQFFTLLTSIQSDFDIDKLLKTPALKPIMKIR